MKVFGPIPWGNWHEKSFVPAPVGSPCQCCAEPILANDLGVLMPFDHVVNDEFVSEDRPWHRDCLIYSIFGRPEDEKATRRKSAAAARSRVDAET